MEHLLGFVLGHEGHGSIISVLRKRNLALELTASCELGFSSNSICALVSIKVVLTDRGLAMYEEVLRVIFNYMTLLRRRGISRRIFDEVRLIERTEWRFREEEETQESVQDLSGEHAIFRTAPLYLRQEVIV